MQEQLLNSNNLKEKLKELGEIKKASPNVQIWLNTVAHKHWLKLLPQEVFTGFINENWYQEKAKDTIFKQLIITPQFTSEVNHLIDFLNLNYQIKKDDEVIYKPLNKLNYLECQRQAKDWIDKINNKTNLEENWEGLKEVQKIEFQDEEYTLYELCTRENLRREGKIMNNCISTYAIQSDEELENKLFLSLRDKSNNSLVNIGLVAIDTSNSNKKYNSLEVIKEYKNKPLTQRGFLYQINEIKEKNNELLDKYQNIVQLFLNKLINIPSVIDNQNMFYISEICQQEINFIKLKEENVSVNKFKTYTTRYVKFEDLTDKDFNNIEYIPPLAINKLKNNILEDKNIPFELMRKTKWINLHNEKSDNIIINGAYEYLKLKEIISERISIVDNISNPNIVLDDLQTIDKKLDIYLSLASKKDSKISINKCVSTRLNIKQDLNTSENINVLIKDSNINMLNIDITKPSVKNLSHGDKNKKLLMCGNVLMIDTKVNDFFAHNLTLIDINTKRNMINNSNIAIFDISSFVNNEKYQSIKPYIDNLNEYKIKTMKLKKVLLSTKANKLNVLNNDFFNLEVEIPIFDKELILLACNEEYRFKEKIINLIEEDSIISNDFDRYRNISLSEDFKSLIFKVSKEISNINEINKSDINSINYLNVMSFLVDGLFSKEDRYMSGEHKEKLETIKDMFIENLEGTRVNNSRTKLTHTFVCNFVNLINYDNNKKGISLSEELREEITEILKTPSRKVEQKYLKTMGL